MTFVPTGRVNLRKTKQGLTWYVIINLKKAEDGTYPQKFINTHLPERGNKKQAEKILKLELEKYQEQLEREEAEKNNEIYLNSNDILFVDYLRDFVDKKKYDIVPSVFKTYMSYVNNIEDYFNKLHRKPLLTEIKASDINDFYFYLRERGLKILTLKHYACVLRPALRQAYLDEILMRNPYDNVKKLKKDTSETPKRVYLDDNEMKEFIKVVKEHKVGNFLILDLMSGLRRGELLGLRWSSIDFNKHILSISGVITMGEDGKAKFVDYAKTEQSVDDTFMNPYVESILQEIKEKQEYNKTLLGNAYSKEYLDFVCVNEQGIRYLPDYFTKTIKKIVNKFGLKDIHFHSLRHSFCSYLYRKTRDIEAVKKMMRHADIKTTEIYAHEDDKELKQRMSSVMQSIVEDMNEETQDDNE